MIVSKIESEECSRKLQKSGKIIKLWWSRKEENNDDRFQTERVNVYDSINLTEIAGKSFLVGSNSNGIDVYNIDSCTVAVCMPVNTDVVFKSVFKEVFIITKSSVSTQVWDEVGSLMFEENEKYLLDVVFSGTGPCVKRTDKESGREELFTMEGHLLG